VELALIPPEGTTCARGLLAALLSTAKLWHGEALGVGCLHGCPFVEIPVLKSFMWQPMRGHMCFCSSRNFWWQHREKRWRYAV